MKDDMSWDHPLRLYFSETLHDSLDKRLGLKDTADVERYLAAMLTEFLDFESIYAIRNASGQPVKSVVEMLAEGDVRQNADSFDRERAVHRHIGDFLLFWSGLFPEFLGHLQAHQGQDLLVDVIKQGQFSYHLVSTFDHGRYAAEAPVFRRLSEEFDAYRQGLSLMRASFEGFRRQGWTDGFEA